MKATIRKRKILNDTFYSLRLDIYPPVCHPETGKLVRWIKLNMRLYVNPKSAEERLENKEAKALAEAVRSRVQLELQAGHYGFLVKEEPVDFLSFYAKVAKERALDKIRACNWECSRKKFIAFLGLKPSGQVPFSSINKALLEGYRFYLQNYAGISSNTASLYFTQLRTVLNDAYRQEIIKTRLTEQVKSIPLKKTKIVYMTQEELNRLYNTRCRIPAVKTAALFSALTGMRFSDIEVLRWEDIGRDEAGYFIHFVQRKTESVNYLPISDGAYQLLGTSGAGVIFPDLRTLHYNIRPSAFKEWVIAAGIAKEATFHTMRHTYATLLMLGNTNLKTLCDMLGHASIKTTMIYAHVVDVSKRAAANVVKLDLAGKEE